MAQNDALTLMVKIIQDPQHGVDAVAKQIQTKLNNLELNLNAKNINISGLSEKFNGVQEMINQLKTHFEKLSNSLKADSLQNVTDSVTKATEALNQLNTQLSKMGTGSVTNFGKAIAEEMEKVEKSLLNSILLLAEVKKATSGGTPADKNVAQAAKEYENIEKLITQINKQLDASDRIGFSTEKLNAYRNQLESIQGELNKIMSNSASRETSDVVTKEKLRAVQTAATAEVQATKEVVDAYGRLSSAYQQLLNLPKMDSRVASLTAQTKELMTELSRLPSGGSRVGASEVVNQALPKLLENIKNVSKEYEKFTQQLNTPAVLKIQGADQSGVLQQIRSTYDKIEAEVQARVKRIQEEVNSRPADTFTKNPAMRDWLQGEMREVERLQTHLTALIETYSKLEAVSGRVSKMDVTAQQPIVPKETHDAMQRMYSGLFGQNQFDFEGMEKAQSKISALRQELSNLDNAIVRASDKGLWGLVTSAEESYTRLQKVVNELAQIKNTGSTSTGLSFKEYSNSAEFKEAQNEAKNATRQLNNAIKEAQKAEAELTRRQTQQNKQAAEQDINRLKKIVQEINSIQAKSPQVKIEGIEKALQEVQALIEKLEQLKKTGASEPIDFGRFSATNAPETVAQLSRDLESASRASSQLTQEQQRMEQAIANANAKGQQQSQILNDLRSMAQQYLSIWGASSFIKDVAQITGELELQQKSLEVILGSAGQAHELYGEIKNLSQMSPFTFQDLLKSTRQLAAFGVETKDLYGTMKNLSDIGAGLNVDVQRLILAYGHVKSAGVLSGIQRRQFETAGINITGEIAKIYNERMKQAGSEERFTAADIFDKTKKREIGFEDVEEAINRLAGPGGKFYDMQLKQFDTLGGKLRNLKNNYNIMLDEIGRSYMSALSSGVDMMNDMMEHWRTWGKLIKDVIAALVAAKVAQIALGKSFAANRAAYASQMALMRERRQVQIVNAGTGSAMFPKVGKQTLGASYGYAVNNSDMSRYQKINAVLRKNVDWTAKEAVLSKQVGKEYAARIKQMNIMANSTKLNTRLQGQWGMAMERLKWTARGFFNTMRAGFAALAANPMMWIGAVIAGITAIVQRFSELNEQERNITKNMKETAAADLKFMSQEFDPIKQSVQLVREDGSVDGRPGHFEVDRDKLAKENPQVIIEQLDEQLQKYDPLYKGTLFDLKGMEDDAARVEAMINNLDIIANAKEKVAKYAGSIATANKESGGVGRDTFLEEAKEFEDAYLEVSNFIDAHADELEKHMRDLIAQAPNLNDDNALKEAAKEYEDFFNRMGDMDFSEAMKRDVLSGKKWVIPIEFDSDIVLNSSDLSSKIEALKKKATPIIAQLKKQLSELKKEDETGELRASYLEQMLTNLMNQEGTELSDPKAVEWLKEQIISMLDDAVEGADAEAAEELREKVFSILAGARVKAQTNDFFEKEEKLGNITFDMSPEQIEALKERFKKQVFDALVNGATDPKEKQRLTKALNGMFESAMKNFTGEGLQIWQKKLKDALQLKNFDRDIKTKFNIKVGADVDLTTFISETQKAFGDARKKVEAMSSTIYTKLGIKVNPSLAFGSFEGLKKLKQDIINATLKNAPSGVGAYYDSSTNKFMYKTGHGYSGGGAYGEAAIFAQEILSMLNIMMNIFQGQQVTGYDLSGTGPGGSNAVETHSSHSRKPSGSSAKDRQQKAKDEAERKQKEIEREETERIRNRIRWMQQLRREYKDLRKYMTPEEALAKVLENYKKSYPKGGPLKESEITMDNLEDFESFFANEVIAIGKNDKFKTKEGLQTRDELVREAEKARQEMEKIRLDEKSNEMSSKMNVALEELTRQIERAKKTLLGTASMQRAEEASGMDEFDIKKGYLDYLIQQSLDFNLATIIQALNETLSQRKGQEVFEPIEIPEIDYDHVLSLDDKGIEEYAKSLVGKDNTAQLTESIANWLKSYKKEYRDIEAKSLDAFLKAEQKRKDYTSQLVRIEKQLKEEKDLIDRSNVSENAKLNAKNLIDSLGKLDELKLETDYTRFMESDITMTPKQMNDMYDKILDKNLDVFANGGMTVPDMTMVYKETQERLRAYNKAQFDNLLDISLMGRLNSEYNSAMADFINALKEAEKSTNEVRVAQDELDALYSEYQTAMSTPGGQMLQSLDEKITRYKELSAEGKGDTPEAKQLQTEMRAIDSNPEVQAIRKVLSEINSKIVAAKANVENKKDKAKEDKDKVKEKYGVVKEKSTKMDNMEKFDKVTKKTVDSLGKFKTGLDFLSTVIDSFGGNSDATSDASDIMGGMLGGASALSSLGPYGMAAGAALGLISGLSQLHDKSLQRKIDAIKEDTEKMSNTLQNIQALRERTLGYDNGSLRASLAAMYKEKYNVYSMSSPYWGNINFSLSGNSAGAAMYEYYSRYSGGSGYQQELKLLQEQREKTMEMYNLENDKKKSSSEELENYANQIAELDQQIAFFVEDLANQLWGIDLKGWASQLGDALMTAFENGESAAGAFKDTVQEIMRGVVKNMLTVGIIEPALENLRKKLFGENGNGGIFNPDDVQGSMGATLNALGNWFSNEGVGLIDAANEFFNGADDMMRQTLGYGMRSSDSSSNTTNSITSTASEETMGIVAGYLARISQDVSVQRIIQEMFVNGNLPDFVEQVTTVNTSLTAIDRNTTAMMEMMRDGNGALYERVENMSRRLDNFANGIDKITVR